MYYIFQLVPIFISLYFYTNYEIHSTMFLIVSSISGIMLFGIYKHYKKEKAHIQLIYPIILSIVLLLIYVLKCIKLVSGFNVLLFSLFLTIMIYISLVFLNKSKTNKRGFLIILIIITLMGCWYNFKTISFINCYIDNNIDYSYLKLNKPKDDIAEFCVQIKFNNFSYRKYDNVTVHFSDEYILPDCILHNEWDNQLPWHTSIKPFKTKVLKYYIPVNSKAVTEKELLNKLSTEAIYIKNNNKIIGKIIISQ